MSEQELKLHVPSASIAALEQQMKQAESISLHALYFDTEDRQLAKAKIAIRLRKEGNDWVQTLKMAGANSISRIELNHTRPEPILDLSLYAGTQAQTALTALSRPLVLRYETIIHRLFRKQRTRKGVIEIAFDRGVARSGAYELPICEVEFELKSGSAESLFDLGLRWLKDYQLVVDLRTKSQRGDALANMAQRIASSDPAAKQKIEQQETKRFWAERRAQPYFIHKQLSATQALGVVSDECLTQIATNASYLAEVDTADVTSIARPEHVHQLRIGMRRLVSNWRLFNKLAHLPELTLRTELKTHLAAFGETRDTDVMIDTIMPLLERDGMPHFDVDHSAPTSATAIARSTGFQSWLLRLMQAIVLAPLHDPQPEKKTPAANPPTIEPTAVQFPNQSNPGQLGQASASTLSAEQSFLSVESSSAQNLTATVSTTHASGLLSSNQPLTIIPLIPTAHTQPSIRKQIERRLSKWNKEIVEHWKFNDRHDIESYHDLRKKIKRIRYGLSVYEGIEGHGSLRAYIRHLTRAQETFGHLNDYSTALTYFQGLTQQHSEAWFAVGWLSAHLTHLKKQADLTLSELPKRIRWS